MKNVLVLIHDDSGQEARLQTALAICRALGGHLTCIDVVENPLIMSGISTSYLGAQLMDEASRNEAANRSAIEARLGREDVPWDFASYRGPPAIALLDAAELADLVIVGSRSEREEPFDARKIASSLAAKAGRPVLAVPPGSRPSNPMGNVLVALDGSRAANEAMRAALPLLQLAESVTLLGLNEPSGEYEIEEAAQYLARHNVASQVVQEKTREKVSDAIVRHADAVGAEYIVMGAHGVSRALEAVFGGVTVAMLENSRVPLLLAR